MINDCYVIVVCLGIIEPQKFAARIPTSSISLHRVNPIANHSALLFIFMIYIWLVIKLLY